MPQETILLQLLADFWDGGAWNGCKSTFAAILDEVRTLQRKLYLANNSEAVMDIFEKCSKFTTAKEAVDGGFIPTLAID